MASGIVHRGFREQPVSRPERSGHKGEERLGACDAIKSNDNSNRSAVGWLEDGDPVLLNCSTAARRPRGLKKCAGWRDGFEG
nr:uncharacterized protein CTRU02_12479 [Colletotrichum truncatum]KAF6784489.1 hypothetical protein CTRU02_12479 [Colletotrichum truncatum]